MKQTEIKALDTGQALELLRVELLHAESNTWLLKSTLRNGRNPVTELLRLARLYQRLAHYLQTQPEGIYDSYGAVRLKYRDIVLAECRRTIYPERHPQSPKAPMKEATPKARKPAASPVNSATSEGTLESKQPRGRAGAAQTTQPETGRKPSKTPLTAVPKSTRDHPVLC